MLSHVHVLIIIYIISPVKMALWNIPRVQTHRLYIYIVWMFLMFSWATGFWSIAIAADCPPPCDERRFISDHCASPLTSSGSLCHCPLHPPTGTLSWKLCDKGIDDLISWKMCFSEILAEKRRGQPCNSNWLQLIVLFFVWYVEANNQIKYWCAYIYCMCVYIYILDYIGTKTSWFAKVTVTWLMTSPS